MSPAPSHETSRHPLTDLSVFDSSGSPVALRSLWQQQATILVFVRHFGCIFCREHIAEVEKHLDDIRSAGGDALAIGNGTVKDLSEFLAEDQPALPVLTDPSKESYRALGFKRGLGSVLGPKVFTRGLSARRRGHKQSRTKGDPLQQGGVLIMAPGDRELYCYRSTRAGDHPPMDEVLAALPGSPE